MIDNPTPAKQPDYTHQEIFDIAARHLLTQGRMSITTGGGCVYRLRINKKTTLKCAAGPFIPDSVYHDSFEGKVVQDLPPYALPRLNRVGIAFLRELQQIHDNTSTTLLASEVPGHWLARLTDVARLYRLDTTILTTWQAQQ
jgi:hypothetical protein